MEEEEVGRRGKRGSQVCGEGRELTLGGEHLCNT